MKLQILDMAREDLVEGFYFYEEKEEGLGDYFLSNLFADIESLKVFGGIHKKVYKKFYRALSKRFRLLSIILLRVTLFGSGL